MSSILDALRKLEDADRPPTRDVQPRTRPPSRLPLIAGVAVAFVAGVGMALWFGGRGTVVRARRAKTADGAPATKPAAPASSTARTHAVSPPVEVASAPVAAPAEPSAPPPPAGRPAGFGSPGVATASPAIPAAPQDRPPVDTEPPRARLLDVPRPVASRAPEPPAAVEPPPEPVAVARPVPEARPEAPPAPPVEHLVATRLPDGAPPVQVNFLAYSRVAGRRTVTLTVGSAGMVTLREGESAGDVQVERIFPDRVQLRHAGRVFAVKAIE